MGVGTFTPLDPTGAVAHLWSHLRLPILAGKQEVVDTTGLLLTYFKPQTRHEGRAHKKN